MQKLIKIGQQKTGKKLPGLRSHKFCCDIRMVGSKFGVNNMEAYLTKTNTVSVNIIFIFLHTLPEGGDKIYALPVEVINHVTADQQTITTNNTMMHQFAIRLNELNDLCFSESKLYIPEFSGGSRSIY